MRDSGYPTWEGLALLFAVLLVRAGVFAREGVVGAEGIHPPPAAAGRGFHGSLIAIIA